MKIIDSNAIDHIEGEEVSSILYRVSQELRKVDSEIGQVESLVGAMMKDPSLIESDLNFGIQGFDHVRQVIIELAKFLETIGSKSEVEWRVCSRTASEHVSLAALSKRLQGLDERPLGPQPDIDLDCYFFEEEP